MNCSLCDTVLVQKADEHYFICSSCGAYVKDQNDYLSAEEEKLRYEAHNNDVNDIHYQKFTSPITNAILNTFSPSHLGLDYGCGTGPVISKVLRDKGYQVNLYDPYFYPDSAYLLHQYDYIFSCEVFEHFQNPKKEIGKLVGLLKDGGHLLIMTHLFENQTDFSKWYYRNDPTHVFIYTKKTMQWIAEMFSLSIEKMGEREVRFKKRWLK